MYDSGADACECCPNHSTALIVGSTSCACLPGYYALKDDAGVVTDCNLCPAGQYCPDRRGEPVDCPSGHWCAEGASTATACPAGTYQPTVGESASVDACLPCPKGSYCESDGMSAHVQCAAGTYQPELSAIDGDVKCLACPAGAYCAVGSSASVACPAGTYNPDTSGESVNACLDCTAGNYCNAGASVPVPCPAGKHRTATKGEALRDCSLCPEGGYSMTTGVSDACDLCPVNRFCQTPTAQQACPTHTTSPTGSYTKLQCACEKGFKCSYHKVIQAIIVVKSTVDDFTNDVGGVKTAFMQTVASAAGVDVSKVVINGVTVIPGTRRRLLSLEDDVYANAANVVVSVSGVMYMEDPMQHAKGGIEIMGHSWEEVHFVHAAAHVA